MGLKLSSKVRNLLGLPRRNRTIMGLKPSGTILTLYGGSGSQSNHYGIETASFIALSIFSIPVAIEPLWDWNDPFPSARPICTPSQSNHYGIETPTWLLSLSKSTIVAIEPLWDWNAGGTLCTQIHTESQSNHYGIETIAKAKYTSLLLTSQSNHYGIETKIIKRLPKITN